MHGNWRAEVSYLVRILRVLATAGLIALGACKTTYLEQPTDQPQNAADIVRAADLRPRSPEQTGAIDTGGASSAKSFSFFGSAAPAPTPAPNAPAPGSQEVAAGGGGYTLNFEDTPIANVAKSVLGDILGVGYVIDPRAQGSITLASGRPIAKKDMLFVLENALHANNLNMVRDAIGLSHRARQRRRHWRDRSRRGLRRRGARIRHDRYPTGICLWSDPGKTDGGLRCTSRRGSNRSNRQAPNRARRRERTSVRARHCSQFRRGLAARTIGRHVPGEKQHAGACRQRTRENHGHGRFRPRAWSCEARSRGALKRNSRRRLEARPVAGRPALDLQTRRAVGGQRQRQGLQSALRRRQAYCRNAYADFRRRPRFPGVPDE